MLYFWFYYARLAFVIKNHIKAQNSLDNRNFISSFLCLEFWIICSKPIFVTFFKSKIQHCTMVEREVCSRQLDQSRGSVEEAVLEYFPCHHCLYSSHKSLKQKIKWFYQ